MTGRPLHALRTPATAFSRTNGSLAPERFTTISCICSTVVNRFEHDEQVRRRRIEPPSSETRESRTRVSVARQYGQCIGALLSGAPHSPRGGCWVWISWLSLWRTTGHLCTIPHPSVN